MEISPKLKEFILRSKVRDLINNNQMPALYVLASASLLDGFMNLGIAELTTLLYEAGIDPLSYMDYVPRYFLTRNSVDHFDVPSHVTELKEFAFYGCTSLRDIKLPSELVKIGRYALSNCTVIQELDLPSSIKQIGEGAFSHCRSLRTLELPDSLTRIESDLCAYCTSLQSIKFPSHLERIGERVFTRCPLRRVDLPDSVTHIDFRAFDDCNDLQDVTLSKSLQVVGERAFPFTGVLEEVHYPGTRSQWRDVKVEFPWLIFQDIVVVCTDGVLRWNSSEEDWELV